jgi:hypothetical protein
VDAGLNNPDQHCGLAGMTVFDALATVRDVVAYAEYTNKHICVLTLDFRSAFDNISHDYLTATLNHYGFRNRMIRRIMSLYETATTMAQINGYMTILYHSNHPSDKGVH